MRWMRSKDLTPEFRNRLDNIIWFDHLSTTVIHQVVDKFIVELQVQLDQKGVSRSESGSARLAGDERLRSGDGGTSNGTRHSGQPENRWRTNCCLARWSTVVRSLSLDSDKNTLTYDFQSAPKHKPEAAH